MSTAHYYGSRSAPVVRARRMAGLFAVLSTLPALGSSAVPNTDTSTAEYARQIAIGVCATCHGRYGNSEQPKFPRLAGQNANYLAAQLRAFRGQTRGDADAMGYMWGMAAELSDATIDALAKYYAGQKPKRLAVPDPTTVDRGKQIYEHGVESAGVPACAACHGPDAHGMADFPRLAGQHSQYVLKQLGAFQSNMRDVAVMHGVAQNLRLPEMNAVAAYLEAQP